MTAAGRGPAPSAVAAPATPEVAQSARIGTLAERSLHSALKARYALPGDLLECALEGYVIDILRPSAEGAASPYECIEIQTGDLRKLKPKLTALLDRHPIRVVHPVPYERTIVRINPDGVILSQRKSPKRAGMYEIFGELVSIAGLLTHAHAELEVVFVREQVLWLDDGRGSWRRKRWSVADRRLIDVVESRVLSGARDYAGLLPAGLPGEFDSAELAAAIRQPRHVAQKMAYCLRAMGVLRARGKRGNALLYERLQ